MAMKKINCKIEGISPLLMHQFPMIPLEAAQKKSAEEQADYVAYRDPDTKQLYVPGLAVQRSLVNAATFSKGKGRASLQKVVAACVMVTPERLLLPTKEYVIDSRRVVIGATQGAVIRHRPRIDTWVVDFTLEYDDALLNATELRKIVDDSGSRVGLLDFRPEKKGPFGRFVVIEWRAEK
jgi:hypothetical protein